MINSLIQAIKGLIGLNIYLCLTYSKRGLNIERVIYEDKKSKVKL